ncbi:plasmid IncI1-type surface exclusion protein ExcA [Serratia symbiotica]|uniref:plasmid IncI1-type surface exclusion protein ExcA n=1 Tax=Serratia symbiotica TaxID=138074 RepID=UPI00135F4906|nr:plasmid IncI1-type surface exclusion protein ExcA [Serratia symbiotica]MBQ0957242.1 plasmid IncI1-type surface exclusion protein ExcA [Serratia symbiotica]
MDITSRLISAKQVWLKALFRTYMILGFPCALLISIPSVLMAPSLLRNEAYLTLSFFIMIWAGVVVPLIYILISRFFRLRCLNRIAAMLSRPDRFSPQKQHQVMDVGGGKYFGIDTRHGTLLYIHRVKKDVIDVIGLSMKDWTRRQLEGSALRLYTRMPDMPVLSIHAHPSVARVLFDTLDAMSHNHYDDPFPDAWPEYVKQQSRFIEFEHDVVVPQVA